VNAGPQRHGNADTFSSLLDVGDLGQPVMDLLSGRSFNGLSLHLKIGAVATATLLDCRPASVL